MNGSMTHTMTHIGQNSGNRKLKSISFASRMTHNFMNNIYCVGTFGLKISYYETV